MVASEWLLFRLSSSLGKMKALETLHAMSIQARESGMSLRELIENDPEVGSALTPEDLTILDQPERYIGQALEIVDHVVEEIETRRRGDLEKLDSGYWILDTGYWILDTGYKMLDVLEGAFVVLLILSISFKCEKASIRYP
jgi:hypothetical protein